VRFASWMSVTSLTLCALGAQSTLWRRVTVFPLDHPLWWATTGTVLIVWLFVAVAALGALRGRPALSFFVAQAPGVMLLAGGLAGRFSFSRTDGAFFGAPFAIGVLWLVTTYRSYRQLPRERRLVLLAASVLFAPLGIVQVRARVPAAAGTSPALTVLPPALNDSERISTACGHGHLELSPLLTFQDASDDGFWPMERTPTVERAIERPRLHEPNRRAALSLETTDAGALLIDAATLVPKPTASHLNRFTDFSVTGLRNPSVRFGATGTTSFPALAFDYPKGRPAHFGALTPSGDFVVWRATSAEKGPFHELGRGPLARGAPVALTLMDGEDAQCTVTWLDFSAQADVTLSPAAGEGVPVNVVQFGKPANDESRVIVITSLAATGIGEGFDTVVHAQGVYRNRVLVEQHGGKSARPEP
jgi:hypothetical protein